MLVYMARPAEGVVQPHNVRRYNIPVSLINLEIRMKIQTVPSKFHHDDL